MPTSPTSWYVFSWSLSQIKHSSDNYSVVVVVVVGVKPGYINVVLNDDS